MRRRTIRRTCITNAFPDRDNTINIKRLFPFLRWKHPTAIELRCDAWAGLSVGLVLIPQALAYATLAGMPPETGLYAALLPSVVGMLWGSSALLAVGPVALTSILVFGSLSPMAVPGSALWVAMAIWLALYAGLMQFLLGAFRMGKITDLVSQPVVTGFINAAAIIILLSQLPSLFGIQFHPGTWLDGVAAPWALSPGWLLTSAFGVAALILLLTIKRLAPHAPGMLVITVLGILGSWLLDYAGHGGAIVGKLPSGLPVLALPPAIPFASHQELWPAALILALISFTEAMSSCRTLARKTNERWDENQELIGQGLAKITSAFSGAFPVSGSFSRSALNLYAGATGPWSSLIAAACVLLSLYFLTPVIAFLPYSVLAAMIMVPVLNLLDIRAFGRLFRISRDDGVVALVTLVVTLVCSPRLHYGVFAGVGLTMVSFLYRRTHPRIIEVAPHEDGTLRDRSRFDLPPISTDVLTVRIDSAVNFLTASALDRFITERRSADPAIRRILICASGINDIDASGVDMLESLHKTLLGDGLELSLSAVKKQVSDVLERAGFLDRLGRDRVFATDAQAVETLRWCTASALMPNRPPKTRNTS